MKDPHRPNHPRSRVKTRKKYIYILLTALIVILISSFFLFINKNRLGVIHNFDHINIFSSTSRQPSAGNFPEENPGTIAPHQTKTPQSTNRDRSTVSDAAKLSIQSDPQLQEKPVTLNQVELGKSETPLSIKASGQQIKENPYQQLVDDLNAFYTHLDQQPYMQDFQLKEPSKNHFSKLLQVLINNPPSITRETDDYFTLLKNTAHFFRVLGKDNILILKGILDREKDSFERILKTFYALTDHPELLKTQFSLSIPPDNLYDYAGFFLNTIGGRLYLFRRDSTSRMTVSYYAVMIIDKANRQGNSRLGIDLRPAIDLLIEEIENTGTKLKLKEEYLDTLYDLKENYSNRG
jgi:hypothetical protein